MKINEIFYSIQGEGFYTGTPAIFIRFSGCNLKCDFCDTQHESGKQMLVEDIVKEIAQYPSKFVVLTGGEPTLQKELENLALKLHHKGYYIAMESNGINPRPKYIDWFTVSPKYKKTVVNTCDELKVVYEKQDMSQYANISAKQYYVQPCDRKDAEKNAQNIQDTINFIKENPKWKISLQTQKILNVQ